MIKIKDVHDFIDREVEIGPVVVISYNEGKNNKGNKYLSITLQDATGTIEAKKWEVSPNDEKLLAVKSVVKVSGFPLIYNESQLQLKLTDVEPLIEGSYNLKELIMSAPNFEYLEKTFNEFIDDIDDVDYKNIVKDIVLENYDRIITHPAARTNHHNYAGGLLHHEVGMLLLAKQIINLYDGIDKNLLYSGIILHDLGKLDELSGPLATEYTLKGKLLGHISIIQTEIKEKGQKYNVSDEKITLLQHLVLSHHGKLEYGSPVLPLTIEAEALAQIDNMDSKLTMINKALKDVEVGGFSNRIPGLDNRAFYKHK